MCVGGWVTALVYGKRVCVCNKTKTTLPVSPLLHSHTHTIAPATLTPSPPLVLAPSPTHTNHFQCSPTTHTHPPNAHLSPH